MSYTLNHQTPVTGSISWSGVHIVFDGSDNAIVDGSTSDTYVYWLSASPTQLFSSNDYPTLGEDDAIVFINRRGVGVSVLDSSTTDGGLVVPGTITSVAIAAGAITADHISAEAVESKHIASEAIEAEHIAANAITSDKILVNSVEAAHIVAEAIEADHLSANSVTTKAIAAGAVTAVEIAAGSVVSEKIAAGAITAEKLLIGSVGSALNSDPNCTDSSAWTITQGSPPEFATITDGSTGPNVIRSPASATDTWLHESRLIVLNRVKTYRFSGAARTVSGSGKVVYLGVALFDADKHPIKGDGAWWYYVASAQQPSAWTRYVGTFGLNSNRPFPSNAVYMAPLAILSYGNGTSLHEVQDLRIEEVADATLIQDGAITTAKIAAGAVTASCIAAGTITASQIAADTITSANIAAGAIGAAELAIGASKFDSLRACSYGNNMTVKTWGVWLNGVSVGSRTGNGRGHTLCVFDRSTHALLSSTSYDTYDNSADALGTALAALDSSVIVVITTVDAMRFDSTGDTARAQLKRCGASNIIDNIVGQSRYAYTLIGYPGIGEGNGIEQVKTNAATEVAADITAFLVDRNIVGTNNSLSQLAPLGTTYIKDGAITTSKITAGAVTANEIAANAITTSKIAAGAITAAQIATDTITATQIAAGAVGATEIAANSILASHLTIADFENLAANGDFAKGPLNWSSAATASVVADAVNAYSTNKNVLTLSPTSVRVWLENSNRFSCKPGDKLYFEWAGKVSAVLNGTAFAYISFNDKDGNWLSSYNIGKLTDQTTYTVFSGEVTVPANVANGLVAVIYDNSVGTAYIGYVMLRRKSDGKLIVDGSITTAKLAAGAVTANEIAANTITSSKIVAGAIGATEIAANAVTAKHLVVGDYSNLAIDPNGDSGVSLFSSGTVVTTPEGAAYQCPDSSRDSLCLPFIPVEPGDQYNFSADMAWVSGGVALSAIGFIGYNAAGAVVNWYPVASTSDTSAGWKSVSGNITIPANVVKVRIWWLRNGTGSACGVWNMRNIVIKKRLGGSLIIDGEITAAKIAAGTITTAQIATDTITSANIAAGAIGASEIAAGAITAGKIAAGAITSTDIATDTITASNIAAGAIGASEIATGAITAGKIAAGAITATQIATDTITAANIAAGAIGASEIATGAITAGKIAAGTITANEIASGAITSSKIVAGAVTATEVATGAITADKILAGAVTADKLTIGTTKFDNVRIKSYGNNMTDKTSGAWLNNVSQGTGGPRGTTLWVFNKTTHALVSVTTYDTFNAVANCDALATALAALTETSVIFITTADACSFNSTGDALRKQLKRCGASTLVDNLTSPGDRYAYALIGYPTLGEGNGLELGKGTDASETPCELSTLWMDGTIVGLSGSVSPLAPLSSTYIKDGSILTAKIAAGAVTANEIAANTITAAKIAAGTITGDKISAGTITGDKISAGTINARHLAVGDFANLVVDPNGDSGVSPFGSSYVVDVGNGTHAYRCTEGVRDSWGNLMPVHEGDQYYFSADVSWVSGAQSRCGIGMSFVDGSGNFVNHTLAASTTAYNSSTWTPITGVLTVPSGCYRGCIWWQRDGFGVEGCGVWNMRNLQIRKRINGGDLIVAGTIVADNIQAGAITDAKIAGYIQSSNYVAGSAGWRIDKSGSAEFNSVLNAKQLIGVVNRASYWPNGTFDACVNTTAINPAPTGGQSANKGNVNIYKTISNPNNYDCTFVISGIVFLVRGDVTAQLSLYTSDGTTLANSTSAVCSMPGATSAYIALPAVRPYMTIGPVSLSVTVPANTTYSNVLCKVSARVEEGYRGRIIGITSVDDRGYFTQLVI